MSRQYYNLPSLNALASFEAVARHQSITHAAAELGVTPGAVSRQIKILESDIGTQLLIRQHKKIQLSKHGRTLHESLQQAFSSIGHTIRDFSDLDESLTFSLGSTIAFSSLWLMPRLNRFWKSHPQIRINHILSDNTSEPFNSGVDISIRYNFGQLPNHNATLLFGDKIYPVCSAQLAQEYQHVDRPEQLTALPLLQLTHDDKSWTDWQQWLKHFKVESPLTNVSSFNNYIIALQAAQDNQGILLGWDKLVTGLIEQGKLVRLLDVSYQSPGSYYLYWQKNKVLNQGAKIFIDWLIQASQLD